MPSFVIKVSGLLLCFGLWFSGAALAAGGTYVSVFVGPSWLNPLEENFVADLTTEVGFQTGVAIGTKVGSVEGADIRLELEAAYRKNETRKFEDRFGPGQDLDVDGDIQACSLMVNSYVDFVNTTSVTPYLGVGLGVARVDYHFDILGTNSLDDQDVVLAYQWMAGLNFALTEQLSLDTEYRYFETDDPQVRDQFGNKGDVEYDAHSAKIGLRYNF